MPYRKPNMTDAQMLEWLGAQYDVNENGCWVWRGSKDSNGYGHVRWKGKMEKMHRLYWLLNGRIIPDALEMCHGPGCSRACYNPDHLKTDTHSANQLDKHRDGTMQTKLTREQVLEIRERTDKNQKELAKEYGVSRATINDIILRKYWAWF